MFSLGVESKRLSKLSKELSVAVTFRTFGTVCHKKLLLKLHHYGIGGIANHLPKSLKGNNPFLYMI